MRALCGNAEQTRECFQPSSPVLPDNNIPQTKQLRGKLCWQRAVLELKENPKPDSLSCHGLKILP